MKLNQLNQLKCKSIKFDLFISRERHLKILLVTDKHNNYRLLKVKLTTSFQRERRTHGKLKVTGSSDREFSLNFDFSVKVMIQMKSIM